MVLDRRGFVIADARRRAVKYEIVIALDPLGFGRWQWTINSVRVKSSPILDSYTRSLTIQGARASAVRFLRGAGLTFPIRVER
jgi:hypothetical protein